MEKCNEIQEIHVKGAATHNLKNLNFSIPIGQLTIVTGVSGSGKTSLVFDTLYAESYRRYVESLSSFARQYMQALPKPSLTSIDNLPAAIAVRQRRSGATSRSTVGTITELQDLLAVIFAQKSQVICHHCQTSVQPETPVGIAEKLLGGRVKVLGTGTQVWIGAEIGSWRSIKGKELKEQLIAQGFSRVAVDDQFIRLEDLSVKQIHEAKLVIDRCSLVEENRERLIEALRLGFQVGRGAVIVGADPKTQSRFTDSYTCDLCSTAYKEPSLQLFSHNHPIGACARCQGFGSVAAIHWEKVIPDFESSLEQGGVAPWNFGRHDAWYRLFQKKMGGVGIGFDQSFSKYTDEQWQWLKFGDAKTKFHGISGYFEWLDSKRYKPHYRIHAARYRRYETCPTCFGQQLNSAALACRIGDVNIVEWLRAPIGILPQWVQNLDNDVLAKTGTREVPTQGMGVSEAVDEISMRLSYLERVGLKYLSLDRKSRTLSGGELQRINMARCLGSQLTDTLYCLDEPTTGLHARDAQKLFEIMIQLRDQGNTVVVVEHDQGLIGQGDNLMVVGPKAGHLGGQLVGHGPPLVIENRPDKAIHEWTRIGKDSKRRKSHEQFFGISGAKLHNLKGDSFEFLVGGINVVCGVSGCGKTSLVLGTLYHAICRHFGTEPELEIEENALEGVAVIGGELSHYFSRVELVSQEPLSRSTRSNIATYLGIFDEIRKLLAATPLARSKKMTSSHFSFNVPGGRCETCKGLGTVIEDMSFLGEVTVTCSDCSGKRFSDNVLEVKLQDKNLSEILNLTVAEAREFFYANRSMAAILDAVIDLGLGYLTVGQHTSSFSGGEAQRLKLLQSVRRKDDGSKVLFILDEPTSGLSDRDVQQLVERFHHICKDGHTILVVEHHLGVVQAADWIVEIGPESGAAGGRKIFAGDLDMMLLSKNSVTGPYVRQEMSRVQ